MARRRQVEEIIEDDFEKSNSNNNDNGKGFIIIILVCILIIGYMLHNAEKQIKNDIATLALGQKVISEKLDIKNKDLELQQKRDNNYAILDNTVCFRCHATKDNMLLPMKSMSFNDFLSTIRTGNESTKQKNIPHSWKEQNISESYLLRIYKSLYTDKTNILTSNLER